MPLTPAQQQEVEKTIALLRTHSGWWNGDGRAAEIIGRLITDRDYAQARAERCEQLLSGTN